jgi:hypothetical protein
MPPPLDYQPGLWILWTSGSYVTEEMHYVCVCFLDVMQGEFYRHSLVLYGFSLLWYSGSRYSHVDELVPLGSSPNSPATPPEFHKEALTITLVTNNPGVPFTVGSLLCCLPV